MKEKERCRQARLQSVLEKREGFTKRAAVGIVLGVNAELSRSTWALAGALLLSSCASGGAKEAAGLREPDLAPTEAPSSSAAGREQHPANHSSRGGQHLLDEAKRLAGSNDLSGAKNKAREAIQADPKLEEGYLLLGSICSMTEDEPCERAAYVEGLAALPRSASLVSQLGLLELRLGHSKTAVEQLERAHDLAHGRDVKIMADLAFAYTFLDRLDDAERLAVAARTSDPSSFEAAMSLGEILLRKKEGVRAIEAFEAALARTKDPEVQRNVKRQLGLSCLVAGQHERALEVLRGLKPARADEDDPMLHAQIAGALMNLGRAKEAVGELEVAVQLAPKDTRFLGLLLKAQQQAGDRRGVENTKKRLSALGVKS